LLVAKPRELHPPDGQTTKKATSGPGKKLPQLKTKLNAAKKLSQPNGEEQKKKHGEKENEEH